MLLIDRADTLRLLRECGIKAASIDLTALDLTGLSMHQTARATRLIAGLPNLRSLDLSFNRLTDECITDLVGAIAGETTQLESLSLAGNLLTDKGVRLLTRAASKSLLLAELNLSENRLTKTSGGHFAILLMGNCAITSLELTNNHLGSDGCAALANSLRSNDSVVALSLSANRITSAGAEALAIAFGTNASLEELWLEDNCIRDRGAIALASALMPEKKDIRKPLVRRARRVDSISLSEAVRSSSWSSVTEEKDVSSSDDDGEAKHLVAVSGSMPRIDGQRKRASGLRGLWISGNMIGEKGVAALKDAKKQSSSLRIVDL